jgi:hypothetical protein
MTKPRTLLFTAFSLSCVALMLSSCDGDDDTIGTSGGAAGKGGTSGNAGKAGGSGRSGGGGRAGKGGTAGAEGGAAATDTGGAGQGAQSGGGGTPSTGGTGTGGTGNVGAAGQSVGGNGAEAGASGSSGAGAGGAPSNELLTCHTGCSTSDDCESQDLEGHCDDTLHLCVECTAHADCTPKANGWTSVCTADADCTDFFLTACIDAGGIGRCAAPPDPVYGCFFGTSQPYPKFGSDPVELVDVCVVDSGRCSAEHVCIIGCTDAPDFCTTISVGYGDTCNETTGQCNCASDDECTAGPSPHCNPVTHLCDECASGDDCSAATTGQDTCIEGRCGCSSISACPASSFPAGTPLCE